MISVTSENRPRGSVPPIHQAIISYDEGSVKITAHSGDTGDTDNEKILHVNISTIGAVDKVKKWQVIEQTQRNGNLYLRLERD